MSLSKTISVSLVLFNERKQEVLKAIQSCLNCELVSQIHIIDNSTVPSKDYLPKNDRIQYCKSQRNLGYGKGHNQVLNKIDSDFHLVVNPDVWFDQNTLEKLISVLVKNTDIALTAPKLLFPNGEDQISSRRRPTISSLFLRFLGLSKAHNYLGKTILESPKVYSTDFLHGAFLLFRTEDFIKIDGFDERYFLYMEDADICLKIKKLNKYIAYCPDIHAYHVLKKESKKSFKLFVYHIKSTCQFFWKWKFN